MSGDAHRNARPTLLVNQSRQLMSPVGRFAVIRRSIDMEELGLWVTRRVLGESTAHPQARYIRIDPDSVAKVFLRRRAKILRAADAFCARRSEGPYRFIRNRSRTSVVALRSDATAEKSKDQLSRDF